MFEFMKSESFNYFFSFLVGLGLTSIFIPRCKGDACKNYKAAPMKDVESTTYQIGSKCYQFASKTVPCPASTDIVEPWKDKSRAAY
jgi:hypothetical protein